MANFVGTWKLDKSSVKRDQYDAIMDELGATEQKELLRDSSTIITYKVTGDDWEVDVEIDKFPGKKETYKLTAGKKLSTKGMDGALYETTFTVDGNKLNETSRRQTASGNWVDFKVSREIKGNVMEVCTECNGKSMQTKMIKA